MEGDAVETSTLKPESSPQREVDASGFWTVHPLREELQTCLRSHPNLSAKAMLFHLNQTGKLRPRPPPYSQVGGSRNAEIPVFARFTHSGLWTCRRA